MARSADPFCYEFAGHRLDPGRHVICSAVSGERLCVPPRIVDIALYFVQRPGELLTKEGLLSGIWPGQVVEENNLTQGISQLRRAFGERRGENRYIVTVPRRGYRFVAAVVRTANGKVCPVAPGPSIAVLPLACTRDDAIAVALAAGVAANVRRALAALARCKVIAPAASQAGSDADVDVQDIGRRLDSRYLVIGSCRRAGQRIRINAQVIDAEEGVYVWSQRFDCSTWDTFDVEDDVALEVVRAVSTITGSIAEDTAPQGESTGTRKSLLSAASVAGSRP